MIKIKKKYFCSIILTLFLYCITNTIEEQKKSYADKKRKWFSYLENKECIKFQQKNDSSLSDHANTPFCDKEWLILLFTNLNM